MLAVDILSWSAYPAPVLASRLVCLISRHFLLQLLPMLTCTCLSSLDTWLSGVKEWTHNPSLAPLIYLPDLPYPTSGIPAAEGPFLLKGQLVISISGYDAIRGEVLKTLIQRSGAQCTDELSGANTHLVCANPNTAKAEFAFAHSIEMVNHLWLMDSILTWTWQDCATYSRSGRSILLARNIWTLLDDPMSTISTFLSHPQEPKLCLVRMLAAADIC